MLTTTISAIVFLTVFSPTLSAPRPRPQEAGQPAMPVINWGKCPELAPKPNEKETKANIIKGCLSSIPLPTNITQEAVERHRTAVAKCALAKENWFTPEGRYKFDKAATEVRNKRLKTDLETAILNQHTQCRSEAENQFKEIKDVINQVQLYQACMDYHISQICSIQITGGQQAGRPRESQ